MDISNLTIIGIQERQEINGFVPKQAQFAVMNPNNTFIEKFYKINENGTLMYWGERNGWFFSEYNINGVDSKKLQNRNFIKLI